MNVGQNPSRRDGHIAQQFVELLVIFHRQSDVTRNNAGLFVVAGSVAGQFQNFGTQIFQNGGDYLDFGAQNVGSQKEGE